MKQEAVLFLCWYRSPYGGNFIASMQCLAASLQNDGVRTAFVFPASAKERPWCRLLQKTYDVYFLDDGASKIKQGKALLQIVDQTAASVLHVHFSGMDLSAFCALLRPKLRLVWHYHSDFSAGRRDPFSRRCKRTLAKLAEHLIGKKRIRKITVSEAQAAIAPEYRYIANALVPKRCAGDILERAATRERFGIADDQMLVLAFAWSPYIKGGDIAAQAVAKLRADGHTEFILGLIGGREYPPEKMKEYLQAHTALRGDEAWILHLPPEEDVFRYHKASDVMLSASRSEAFSYAMLEALYTGRPCVCSDVPGVQWARRYETATYFASEDVDACAAAILSAARQSKIPAGQQAVASVAASILRDYGIENWVTGVKAVLLSRD